MRTVHVPVASADAASILPRTRAVKRLVCRTSGWPDDRASWVDMARDASHTTAQYSGAPVVGIASIRRQIASSIVVRCIAMPIEPRWDM